jgi:hypothetical protein
MAGFTKQIYIGLYPKNEIEKKKKEKENTNMLQRLSSYAISIICNND